MCQCIYLMALTLVVATANCSTDARNGYGPAPTPQARPTGWQTYTDAPYGFAIDYPPEYIVLSDAPTPTVQRVQFQRRDIAGMVSSRIASRRSSASSSSTSQAGHHCETGYRRPDAWRRAP